MADLLINRTFGGILRGTEMTRVALNRMRGDRLTQTTISFSAITMQCANVSEFVGALAAQQAAYGVDHSYGRYAIIGPREIHRKLHEEWWGSFWNKLCVGIDAGAAGDAFAVSQQVASRRFLDGSSRGGQYPSRFTGELWTESSSTPNLFLGGALLCQ